MDSRSNADDIMPCTSSNMQVETSIPAPIRKRRFSSAKIQPTRIKKVMQSDEEIGRMVASVPVAVGRAMEHFAEKLLEAAALCVQCSNSRTLSPSHMKQVVVHSQHLAFLLPIMRGISLPPSVGSELISRPECGGEQSLSAAMVHTGVAQEPSISVNVPPPMPLPNLSIQKPLLAPMVAAKRRQSNGEVQGIETKPKRGRPRKIRKEERCVEDDGVISETKLNSLELDHANGSDSFLSDRELMPPPSMLPLRALSGMDSKFSGADFKIINIAESAEIVRNSSDSLQHDSTTS